MSFDIETLDVKSRRSFTPFEVEAERRREVLMATSRDFDTSGAAVARPSRLSALAQPLERIRTARKSTGSNALRQPPFTA